MQKRVNLVDLVKSFQPNIHYLVSTCKIRHRYSRERASQSLSKISQKLEYELEKHRVRPMLRGEGREGIREFHARREVRQPKC